MLFDIPLSCIPFSLIFFFLVFLVCSCWCWCWCLGNRPVGMAKPTWLTLVGCVAVWMSSCLLVSSKITQLGAYCPLRRLSNDTRISGSLQEGPLVAVFLQADRGVLFRESLGCLKNVLEQSHFRADVFIGTHAVCEPKLREMLQEVVGLIPKKKGALVAIQNYAVSSEIFLEQMKDAIQMKTTYDYALKIVPTGDAVLRQRIQESLCGTTLQIESIVHQFIEKPNVDLIAPLGLLYGPDSDPTNIMPHLLQKYPMDKFPSSHFGSELIEKVIALLDRSQFLSDDWSGFSSGHLLLVEGSSYWFRMDQFELGFGRMWESLLEMRETLFEHEQGKFKLNRLLDTFIPTSIQMKDRQTLEITPAPRPMAIYSPRYHESEINDRLWGKGSTEWTLLRSSMEPGLRKPLGVEKGGLGYYDLLDTETRRRQGQLAQKGGVYGFVYYHYWFNGEVSLPEHKALYGVLEKMLDDGEPNLPFMLSWVNEPWTKTRASNKEEILLSQNYGNMREWEEHFNYLYKFFSHPNYIRIMDEPVFIIYKTFHIGSILPAMLKCWNNLAKERGLKGIKIVSTIGDFPRVMELPPAIEETTPIHGSFHFWPKLQSWKALETFAASQRDVTQFPPRNQYWGVCSGSDQRVRGISSTLPPLLVSPKDFGKEMRSSFWAMSQKAGRDIDLNYFFINAWNEWNEQATLEPDTMYRFGYLNELRGSLRRVPALWREPVREPERVWADPSRESLGDDDADESSKRHKGSNEKRRKRERAKLENANKILI